jgi:hypothetical protein
MGGELPLSVMPGFMPGIHVFLQAKHLTRREWARQGALDSRI